MKVFAPAPFRWPAITGTDYPYGHQEIADDSLARTLISAGLVQDESKGPDPVVGQGLKPYAVTDAKAAALDSLVSGDGFFQRIGAVRVAMFGDSTASIGSRGSPTDYTDQEYMTVAAGTTTTTGYNGATSKFLLDTQYAGAIYVANAGWSGQTTADMMGRDGNAAAPNRRAINDIAAKTPHVILFRGASINDVFGLNLSTYITPVQLQAIVDRHINLWRKLRHTGAYVLDEGCAGYDATNGVPPANQAYIRDAVVRLNAAFEAWHTQNNTKSWLSPVGVTCNADGSFITGVTGSGDGTHLSYGGQYRLAKAEARRISAMLGLAPGCAYTGANLLDTLSQFVVGGSLPTGYVWTGVNCSSTSPAIEIDPTTGEICIATDVTSLTAGAQMVINLPFNIYSGAPAPAITVTSGMKLGIEFDWSVETKDGSNIGPGFYSASRVDVRNSGGGRAYVDWGRPSVVGDQGDLGVSRIDAHTAHAVVINDVTANLTSSSAVRVAVNLPTTATYRMRLRNPKIVQLT